MTLEIFILGFSINCNSLTLFELFIAKIVLNFVNYFSFKVPNKLYYFNQKEKVHRRVTLFV